MEKSNNVYVGISQNIKSFFAMKQQQHKITDAYYKRFGGNPQTLDRCEVKISDHKLLQKYKEKLNPSSNKDKNIQMVQDKFPGTDFIFNSDQHRYNTLL